MTLSWIFVILELSFSSARSHQTKKMFIRQISMHFFGFVICLEFFWGKGEVGVGHSDLRRKL